MFKLYKIYICDIRNTDNIPGINTKYLTHGI